MGLAIRAEANDINQQQWEDASTGAIKSRVDKAGTFVTSVTAEPATSDLANNECAMWFDTSTKKVKFVGKVSGTVFRGEVALT